MNQHPKWGGTRAVKATKQHKATSQAANAPCAICGQPIDYQAPAGTPNAYELDHIQPRSTHPELTYDPDNYQPTHTNCNRSKQNTTTHPIGPTTTNW